MTSRTEIPSPSRAGPYYIAGLAVASMALGLLAWRYGRHPDLAPLLLLSAMGILSFNLREPTVTSRIGFSFLSIILLASAAILGPFGAWCVGVLSQAIERDPKVMWFQRVFNIAMTGIIGLVGAGVYLAIGGAQDLDQVSGFGQLALRVGLPLIVADVIQCLTNAVLLSGAITLFQGVPFWVFVRRVLVSSGVAYVGYGVIGFLFVVLWYPVDLGAFSALLIMAPLLAARWAFVQFGEELRSHERVVETLVTALGTKEPSAVDRSRREARLAEWIAEELGLGPHQIETVRYAATLHEIGHLGVPTRLLRRAPEAVSVAERRVIDRHSVMGARMIEGIDFLEDARSGIRHQHERFDGDGRPDGLVGTEIPIAARIVAVAGAVEDVTGMAGTLLPDIDTADVARTLQSDPGRFDPTVVTAVLAALEKHGRPQAASTVVDR
ncbi:HD-GYP domain-containing protein [Terrabacter aerolatus]|uniref:Metal-dependent phosphohydrolase n=1 Tax=Terrabacter aerolatus TaxID=422442 RepID=A0A512D295_9MICO|nr:HD domain-containing phosphohydrolase [Terrabacter aerolatus]GEO30360.1 metal-dependent phosphohydrolase [Terrabacter aerolatus]